MTKIMQFFPLTQSKCGSDPKILGQFAIRFQSKINNFRNRPDPVQPKSSPMIISDRHILQVKMKTGLPLTGVSLVNIRLFPFAKLFCSLRHFGHFF